MKLEHLRVARHDPADGYAEITVILNRAYAQLERKGLEYVATWQDEKITQRRAEKGECWVALLGGNLVGTIVFEPAESTSGCEYYDLPGVSSFHQFGVLPELQGKGIGDALLSTVERRAKETGAREIALDTAMPAWWLISMYERRGYRVVGMADWEPTNYLSFILAKAVTGS